MRVTVHDGSDRLVFDSNQVTDPVSDADAVVTGAQRAVAIQELWLPVGLYRFTTHRLGQTRERIQHHTGGMSLGLDLPLRATPLPIADSDSSHEYYSEPARLFATERTSGPVGELSPVGGIMVMVRASERSTGLGRDLGSDLSLLDDTGRVITTFATAATSNRR